MNRKFKLLPGILLLALCFAVLGVGIYAAQPASNNISGTITVNAANAEVDIEVYQVTSAGASTKISEGSTRTGLSTLSYGELEFDTSEANNIYDVDFQEIRIKLSNKSTSQDLGAYFWNKEDTDGLHLNEEDFVLGSAPTQAIIGTKTVSNEEVEASDILYGHKLHNSGSVTDVLDYEYEFYNHLPKATVANDVVTPTPVNMTIYVRVNKLSEDPYSVNIPVYLNIEPYNATENITTDANKGGIVTNAGFVKLPVVENETSCPVFGAKPDSTTYSNTDVTHVVIPNNITTLPERSFQGNASLKAVTIPNSVTTIGTRVFPQCTNLRSAILPNNPNFTTIPVQMFAYCSNLTSITIPDSVTSIGDGVFGFCSSLRSVILPNNPNFTTIPKQVFYQCTSLTSITIPDSVTSIGQSAFNGSGLTSVVIPNSVTTFGQMAFDSSGLRSVTLPNNPNFTTIPLQMFCRCPSLTSIIIPDSVTSIGQVAFGGCSSLRSITLPNNPNFTTIPANMVYACTSLTSIDIPNSVTSIGESAFKSCSELTSIIIPSSVTSIGDQVFNACASLTSVNLDPDVNITFSEGCFQDAGLSGEFHISKNWTFSGTSNGQFLGTKIERFTVDADDTRYMTYNGDGCVYKRKSTDSTSADYNVPVYLEFYPNGSTNTVYTIPSTVTGMRRYEFQADIALERFEVENGNTVYTAIDGILYNKSNLSKLSLLTMPEKYASTNVTVGSGDNSIYNFGGVGDSLDGYGFANSKVVSITIENPSTVKYISGCACQYSTELERINSSTVGEYDLTGLTSLTNIGYKAFEYCEKLTTFRLPSSLTELGDGVFMYATNLTNIYLYNTSSVVKLNKGGYAKNYENNFANANVVIHVPSSMLSAYKSSTYWSAMASKIVGDL